MQASQRCSVRPPQPPHQRRHRNQRCYTHARDRENQSPRAGHRYRPTNVCPCSLGGRRVCKGVPQQCSDRGPSCPLALPFLPLATEQKNVWRVLAPPARPTGRMSGGCYTGVDGVTGQLIARRRSFDRVACRSDRCGQSDLALSLCWHATAHRRRLCASSHAR